MTTPPPPGISVLRLSQGGTIHLDTVENPAHADPADPAHTALSLPPSPIAEVSREARGDRWSRSPVRSGRGSSSDEEEALPARDDIGIYVRRRRCNKSELRIVCVGTVSSMLLVASVVLMVLGSTTSPSDPGDYPPPPPLPQADDGFVVSGGLVLTRSLDGSEDTNLMFEKFSDRRFREDMADVVGVPEQDVIVTSVAPDSSGGLLVSFNIFVPTLMRAIALQDTLRAQAADLNSPLMQAPSIRGSPGQVISLSVKEIVAGWTNPMNEHPEGDSFGDDGTTGVVHHDPVVNAVAETPGTENTWTVPRPGTEGQNGIFSVAGDGSFTAYVNGHAIGSRHETDAGFSVGNATLLPFVAPCDGRQVFAIVSEAAAAIPSVLAQIDHCGAIALTNPSWKCAAETQASSLSITTWTDENFDDSLWHWAVDGGSNGVEPWGVQTGVSAHARWIWPRVDGHVQTQPLSFCLYVWDHGSSGPWQVPTDVPVGGDNGQLHVAVDDGYTLFVNGRQLGTGTAWTHTDAYSFTAPCSTDTVYGIEAVDTGGEPAILAEITHCGMTFETGQHWRCSPVRYEHWNMPGFDDSEWANAVDGGANGVGPWNLRPQISGGARWIWTSGNDQARGIGDRPEEQVQLQKHHATVFCRWVETHPADYSSNNCPAAIARYYRDYPDVARLLSCSTSVNRTDASCGYGLGSHDGAFRHWSDFGQRQGRIWRHELCGGNRTDRVMDYAEAAKGHVHITGDTFVLFVDGLELGRGNDWTRRHFFEFYARCEFPTVFAVKVSSSDSYPTIAAEIDHCGTSFHTSTRWRCSAVYSRNWEKREFDDSAWDYAEDGGSNGLPPWGSRPDLSDSVRWIWSSNGTNTIFCRITALNNQHRNCPAAQDQYRRDYPSSLLRTNSSSVDAFAHFRTVGLAMGLIWRSSLCDFNGSNINPEVGRGRPVMASSSWSVETSAGQANDGNYDGNHYFQSSGNDNPDAWWRVELDHRLVNPLVRIHARDCCTSDFRHALQIRISNVSVFEQATVCASITPRYGTLYAPVGVTDGGVFDARCIGTGKYVFVATEPDFLYVSTPLSWVDASTHCKALSRELVSVHSIADIGVVASMVSPGIAAWIGLNDRGVTDCRCDGACFQWSDGTANNFVWWNDGEPNEYGLDGASHCSATGGRRRQLSEAPRLENCVLLESTQRGWTTGYSPPYGYSLNSGHLRGSDTTCSFKYPFVCGPVNDHHVHPGMSQYSQWLTMAEVEILQSADAPCSECYGHIHVAVDSAYTFWVNGIEIGSGNSWSHTDTYSFFAECDGTTVYAIAGLSAMGKPSILAEIVHCGQIVRTSTSWSCMHDAGNVTGSGAGEDWTRSSFTETPIWLDAVDGGSNGVPPWGPRKDLSPQAKWIWASGGPVSSRVKCRLSQLHAVPDCEAAQNRYISDYPALRHSGLPAWTHFINYGRPRGLLWHGELCQQSCGGTYVSALEGRGAYLEQRLQQLRPYAKYRVKFLAAGGKSPARAEQSDSLFPSAIVKVDGIVVWSRVNLETEFHEYSAQFMSVGSSTAVLRFENTSPEMRNEEHSVPMSTIFVDEVEINQIQVYSPTVCGGVHSGSPCASAPCLHSANGCVEESGSYQCFCSHGWHGHNCAQQINECDSNPCQNGASCSDGLGFYSCSCLSHFTGANCANDIDECYSHPCLHTASVCMYIRNEISCTCAMGWSGDLCEHDVDECSSSPCGTGGRCFDGVGTYTCQCEDGWHGQNCEQRTQLCAPDNIDAPPCDPQRASCSKLGPSSHSCECHYGYTTTNEGRTCTPDNCCLSSPCLHGGSCVPGFGNYTCVCLQGFVGDNCFDTVDTCESFPCQHNGACASQSDGTYTCGCKSGFEGPNCARDINECSSVPCQNGASRCDEGINMYSCTCANGWTGQNCAENVAECARNPCTMGMSERGCTEYLVSISPPNSGSMLTNGNLATGQCGAIACHAISNLMQCTGRYRAPTSWTSEQVAVICNDNAAVASWGGLLSRFGFNYAALVDTGAYLEQTILGLTRGHEYSLTFFAALHPAMTNRTALTVKIGGLFAVDIADLDRTWRMYTVPFTARSPTTLLRIETRAADDGAKPGSSSPNASFFSDSQSIKFEKLRRGICLFSRNSSIFVDKIRLYEIDVRNHTVVFNEGFEADDEVADHHCTQPWASPDCNFRYITPQGWQGSFHSTVVLTNGNPVWGGVSSANSEVCLGETPDDGTAHVSVDNRFTMFVNGNIIGFGSNWQITQPLSFTSDCAQSTVYAIEAWDDNANADDVGALLAVITHCGEQILTGKKWRCTNLIPSDQAWQRPGFDDSSWLFATDFGANGEYGPWFRATGGEISQISPAAHWIWTAHNAEDNHIVCRVELRHQLADCLQARMQYLLDYPDVKADSAFNSGDGSYQHFLHYGRLGGRMWHSELCESNNHTFSFPPCADAYGSMSESLIALMGPGEYALCPGREWLVPGFESFGPVTCFNEELCKAVGSSCAGLLADVRRSSTCEEHLDCAAYRWDAGACQYSPGSWSQYHGNVVAVASSSSGNGHAQTSDMAIADSIYPESQLFRMVSPFQEHYQVVLRFEPPAPIVYGVRITVAREAAGPTGFSGIEIGTVSAGSGTVRQQIVRHQMFGTYAGEAKWTDPAPDFHFNDWTDFTFPRAVQNVEQIRITFDYCSQDSDSTYGFSLHSISPVLTSSSLTTTDTCTLGTRALALDGSTWLEISHATSRFNQLILDGDGLVHFTVELWVRITVQLPHASQMMLYEDDNRIWMTIEPHTNRVVCGARDLLNVAITARSSTPMSSGQWTHLACVFAGQDVDHSLDAFADGDEGLYVFVDGQLDGSTVGPLNRLSNGFALMSSTLLIGAHRVPLSLVSNNLFEDLAMAEVGQIRFWSVPRTTTELRSAMYTEVDVDAAHLVAYFDFAERPEQDLERPQHNITLMQRGGTFHHGIPLSNWSVSEVKMSGPCVVSNVGCADGSREGFEDQSSYRTVAACGGQWVGAISSVSADSLCSLHWHVCSGVEIQQEHISVAQSCSFLGAFAFDSANDCGNCHSSCLGAMTGTSINGFCPVSATDYTDPDMECMGSDCIVRDHMSSCLSDGRTDTPRGPAGHRSCEFHDGLSGVVCCRETGCADRTREGLQDHKKWPSIAVCDGEWRGQIGGPSAAALCAVGWHVCTGDDVRAKHISIEDATAFDGCFAFDSANDCGNCHATCLGAMTGTSINGKCAVSATDMSDPDLHGMGGGCTERPHDSSCLADGRLNAEVSGNRNGCDWFEGLSGVVCCEDPDGSGR